MNYLDLFNVIMAIVNFAFALAFVVIPGEPTATRVKIARGSAIVAWLVAALHSGVIALNTGKVTAIGLLCIFVGMLIFQASKLPEVPEEITKNYLREIRIQCAAGWGFSTVLTLYISLHG